MLPIWYSKPKLINALKLFTPIFNFFNTAILVIPMLQTNFENC